METRHHSGWYSAFWDRIKDRLLRPSKHGKHRRGRQQPKNYKLKLKARRKRERQHRRRVRLQEAGRKHRC